MVHSEAQAALRILLAVACADGQLASDEEHLLDVIADRLHEEATSHVLDGAVDVEREAKRIKSAEGRRATFEAAVALANVDGTCSPAEHVLLGRLKAWLDLDASLDLAAEEAKSAARVARVRQSLESATIDFLTRVRRASEGKDEIDPREYDQMVRELAARKHELLSEALEDG